MQDIRLKWAGVDYVIPAHRAFQIGERIEDIATLPEIIGWGRAPKFIKLARCYGTMLRFAGADVTDEEIHARMMAEVKAAAIKAGAPEGDMVPAAAIQSLIAVLMDGAPEANSAAGAGAGGKPTAS